MKQSKHEGYTDSFPYLYLSQNQHLILHVQCLITTQAKGFREIQWNSLKLCRRPSMNLQVPNSVLVCQPRAGVRHAALSTTELQDNVSLPLLAELSK